MPEKIISLYASGCSLSEVAATLNLSPSGVRYILAQHNVTMRSRSDAVRIKHNHKLKSHTSSVPDAVPHELLSLYIAGLALYWGEGAKTGNTVALANSDPDLVLTFLSFLRVICGVDEKRLRILVHYHADQNEEKLIDFWSRVTKIRKNQFYQGTLHQKNRGSTKGLKFGTISLRYSDANLLKDILKKIDRIKVCR